MTEAELLDALDRRVRGAVDALQAATAGDPPDLPVQAPPHRGRAWVPLLVAAALVVVALVAAGVVLAGSEERGSPVAGERDTQVETGGGPTRLALADPGAEGYDVRAAFEAGGAEGSTSPEPPSIRWTAHVPEGADPAEGPIVLTGTTPADEHTFTGRLVDVGGPEAVVQDVGTHVRLLWRVEAGARELRSAGGTADELTEVARSAVAAGWDGAGALPGHEVLHEGPLTEFSSTLAFAASGPSGRAGVAYDDDGADRDFVIGWSTGPSPEARWHARRAMAVETVALEIRGRDATLHRFGPRSPAELSWLEADGTLVEVVFGGDADAVLPALDRALAPIDGAAHATLVRSHPPAPDQPVIDLGKQVFEPMDDEAVATVELALPVGRYLTSVTRAEDGTLALILELEDETGRSGAGHPVRDLGTTVVTNLALSSPASAGIAIGGLVADGVDHSDLRAVDRTTGSPIEVVGLETAPVPGSDHEVLVAVVAAPPETARLDVTFATGAGEVTWRL